VEIVIVGDGGQGVVRAGELLGSAATYDGKYATQISVFSSAQRGFPLRTDIIISTRRIDFMFVQKPDFFICMSQGGFDKYFDAGVRSANPVTILDINRVTAGVSFDKNIKFVEVKASEIAQELNAGYAANMVLLGALVSISNIVSVGSMERTIKKIFPKGSVNKNLEAFVRGTMTVTPLYS
jgi:2-oxoglutarate ferredoxin oxidoreductase subunit gamma